MQIQGTGLNTVIPTAQRNRKAQVMLQNSDSVSFSGKEAVIKKSFLQTVKSLLTRIESPIKIPKVEKFDELITRLKEQGIKYEVVPANSREYKKVKIYNSSSETPSQVYSFKRKGSLFSITQKGGLNEYRFRSNGSPLMITILDKATNRTKAYVEFNHSDVEFVTLNPNTKKYFEHTQKVKYNKKGEWIEYNVETEEPIGPFFRHPKNI